MLQKLMNLKTIYYVTTIIIALLVGIVGGIVDILQTKPVIESSTALGYPLYFFTLLGVFKIIGGSVLLLPQQFSRIKDFAYFGFAIDFIFASFSHYSIDDNMIKIAIPIILLFILFISYILQNKVR